jgi:hypothetical protein
MWACTTLRASFSWVVLLHKHVCYSGGRRGGLTRGTGWVAERHGQGGLQRVCTVCQEEGEGGSDTTKKMIYCNICDLFIVWAGNYSQY